MKLFARAAKRARSVAPLAIRPARAWTLRVAAGTVAIAAAAGTVWGVIHFRTTNDRVARQRLEVQVTSLSADKAALEQALAEARTQLAERERQAKIDAAAQADLTRSVAQLQDENAKLGEDLALMRKITSGATTQRAEGIDVGAFKVEPDGDQDQYRYRAMLSYRHKREAEFRGHATLVVHLLQNGRATSMTVSQNGPENLAAEIRFKYYQKLEGTFRVAAGARVRSVELQVFEQGRPEPVATRNIAVS